MGKGIQVSRTTDARAWKLEPGGAFRQLQALDIAGARCMHEGVERSEVD